MKQILLLLASFMLLFNANAQNQSSEREDNYQVDSVLIYKDNSHSTPAVRKEVFDRDKEGNPLKKYFYDIKYSKDILIKEATYSYTDDEMRVKYSEYFSDESLWKITSAEVYDNNSRKLESQRTFEYINEERRLSHSKKWNTYTGFPTEDIKLKWNSSNNNYDTIGGFYLKSEDQLGLINNVYVIVHKYIDIVNMDLYLHHKAGLIELFDPNKYDSKFIDHLELKMILFGALTEQFEGLDLSAVKIDIENSEILLQKLLQNYNFKNIVVYDLEKNPISKFSQDITDDKTYNFNSFSWNDASKGWTTEIEGTLKENQSLHIDYYMNDETSSYIYRKDKEDYTLKSGKVGSIELRLNENMSFQEIGFMQKEAKNDQGISYTNIFIKEFNEEGIPTGAYNNIAVRANQYQDGIKVCDSIFTLENGKKNLVFALFHKGSNKKMYKSGATIFSAKSLSQAFLEIKNDNVFTNIYFWKDGSNIDSWIGQKTITMFNDNNLLNEELIFGNRNTNNIFKNESTINWNFKERRVYKYSNYKNDFVDVDEISFIDFNFYPNPTEENLTIKLNKGLEEVEVSIFDMEGRILFVEEFNSSEIKVNLPTEWQGIYILQVKTEKGSSKRKIFVN